jgi:leader peptidase (prepilin peptidase)/N-methyltransferase
MMHVDSRLPSLGLSIAGAALGYGLLWLIVEFGKLAFGKKKHVFPKEEPFVWKRDGETASIKIGEDVLQWEEIFGYRPADELVLNCSWVEIGERKETDVILRIRFDRMWLGQEEFNLDDLDTIAGSLRSVVIPREAMGFGDVKFIACIGAFLGWQAVLFTICSASIIGCVAAIGGLFMARDKAGSRVPFGPFLALGAAIWIFYGEKIWNWYFGMFQGNDPSLL